MPPELERFDHIHVFVPERASAERWYAEVLGLLRVPELVFWSADGGPLTIENASGTVRLALFEGEPRPCRSTIAFTVDAEAFMAWRRHLAERLPEPARLEDHEISWSLYFTDPHDNPFEITCYEYETLSSRLASAT